MAVDGESATERRGRFGPLRPRLALRRPPVAGPSLPEGTTSAALITPAIETIEAHGLRWIQIERPRLAEREWLAANFDFHPLAYEDLVSRNQRPKVDAYEEHLFIVLYFPAYEKATGRLRAMEVDLFVGPDYVITLPNEHFVALSRLFERVETHEDVRDDLFAYGPAYLLYRIVDEAVDAGFPMLRAMGAKLEDIEDELFAGRSDELVRDISNVKQEIINFRRIVRPQRLVYRDLERAVGRYRAPDLDLYFDDITDASERMWDVLENYKEVVEGLESTNESVISHRVNDILRVLTVFSVLILPLTFVASMWGMNVAVPFGADEYGFVAIAVIMAVVLLATLVAFRRMRIL